MFTTFPSSVFICNLSGACHVITVLYCIVREISMDWPMEKPEGQHVVKVHGVGDVLCQGLIYAQCSKSPKEVTTMAEALDDHRLKEEATQLRGWLVCQSI